MAVGAALCRFQPVQGRGLYIASGNVHPAGPCWNGIDAQTYDDLYVSK